MGARMCAKTRRLKICYETREAADIAANDVGPGSGHRRKAGRAQKPLHVYACGDHWHTSGTTKR